jgi:site-specific DNA-methyltransferase (cytosine-N4-specific)
MDKFFTTDDAGKYLGVTASRVRQLIIEKRIKSEKVGRDHLIREAILEYYAQHGKKTRGRPKNSDTK